MSAGLTQTQPRWLMPNSLELCSLSRHVFFLGKLVRRRLGQQLEGGSRVVASHTLSGKNAPAHTGGGPGGSWWTRSMDGQGRPWLRSAGWGRTAAVAVKAGGRGKRLRLGVARVGRGITFPGESRLGTLSPGSAAFRPRTAQSHCLPAQEPVLDTPGTWRQRLSSGPALLSHPVSYRLLRLLVSPFLTEVSRPPLTSG